MLLVVRRLNHIRCNDQKTFRRHHSLHVVALLKPAARQPKDQINLTDEDSRITPVAVSLFEAFLGTQFKLGARLSQLPVG